MSLVYVLCAGGLLRRLPALAYNVQRLYNSALHVHSPWTIQLQTCSIFNHVTRRHNQSSALHPRTSPSAAVESMANEEVKEGVLLGLGNPLLDITVSADEAFLKKYKLEPNNAILASPYHQAMFDEMMQKFNPNYGAGGATQNSIRVAQWLLKKKKATTFFGCVGRDEKAEILQKEADDDGVNVQYQVEPRQSTGVCGAIITGEHRSLVAYLGAADYFMHKYLETPENWALVEKAEVYYIGGFVFPVCTQGILDIAQHACDRNKTLVMNLSAPFLCKYFADTKSNVDIMPYIDILFGNEAEAAEFCKLRGIEASDIKEMALKTSQLPKKKKVPTATLR